MHDQKLQILFQKYFDELKPLIAIVEAKYEIFPEGILNEIRALYDHTARIAILEIDKDSLIEELKKTERHIHRAKLDCYKVLCIRGEKFTETFEENYKNVKLGEVDSGKFFPQYLKLKGIARSKTLEAKENEKTVTNNEKNVSLLYDEAIVAYEKVEKFIESSFEVLEWAAQYQKKYSKKGYITAILIAFIFGTIATIIGTIVCKLLNFI